MDAAAHHDWQSRSRGRHSSTACAPIYGNGTFALIINFNEGKAPNQVIHECTNIEFVSPDFNFLEGDWIEIIGGYIYPSIPVGTIVTYEILNISPPDALDGALAGEVVSLRISIF